MRGRIFPTPVKILIADLHEAAKDKPHGYFAEVTMAGVVDGDVLHLEPQVYAKLRQKYSPQIAPSLMQQARNVAGAASRVAKAAVKGEQIKVAPEEVTRRMGICNICEHFNNGRCKLCGCIINFKTRLETEHCPDKPPRW
jgi:hypothetical protein